MFVAFSSFLFVLVVFSIFAERPISLNRSFYQETEGHHERPPCKIHGGSSQTPWRTLSEINGKSFQNPSGILSDSMGNPFKTNPEAFQNPLGIISKSMGTHLKSIGNPSKSMVILSKSIEHPSKINSESIPNPLGNPKSTGRDVKIHLKPFQNQRGIDSKSIGVI